MQHNQILILTMVLLTAKFHSPSSDTNSLCVLLGLEQKVQVHQSPITSETQQAQT